MKESKNLPEMPVELKQIKSILDKYDKDDFKLFYNTVDELCGKGIAKGCFQDYQVLFDVVAILTASEQYIQTKEV